MKARKCRINGQTDGQEAILMSPPLEGVTGVASYEALGHVPTVNFQQQSFFSSLPKFGSHNLYNSRLYLVPYAREAFYHAENRSKIVFGGGSVLGPLAPLVNLPQTL